MCRFRHRRDGAYDLASAFRERQIPARKLHRLLEMVLDVKLTLAEFSSVFIHLQIVPQSKDRLVVPAQTEISQSGEESMDGSRVLSLLRRLEREEQGYEHHNSAH